MRTVEQWFGEYGESHTHPRNELLHIICVPPIVMTVIGFLWSIPVPLPNNPLRYVLVYVLELDDGTDHRRATLLGRSAPVP